MFQCDGGVRNDEDDDQCGQHVEEFLVQATVKMVRSSLRDPLVIGSRPSNPSNKTIVVTHGQVGNKGGLGVNDKRAVAKAHQHPVIEIVADHPSQIDYRESRVSQETAQHIAFADGGCRLRRCSYKCRIDANLSGADIVCCYRPNIDG